MVESLFSEASHRSIPTMSSMESTALTHPVQYLWRGSVAMVSLWVFVWEGKGELKERGEYVRLVYGHLCSVFYQNSVCY